MKYLYIFLIIIPLLAACAAPRPTAADAPDMPIPHTLTVFAAASLTGAFGEVGKAFEAAHPGLTVRFSFAGSQALRTQIEQGAAADVFASANTKEMSALQDGKLVISSGVKLFVANQLVVTLPAQNPGGLSTLADLAKPGLKLVLAAKDVPVGGYALQVLDKLEKEQGAGFKAKVLANVVSYENDVKQVVTKVQLGEADAGIVYATDAAAVPGLLRIEIPGADNVIAQYPIAPLSGAKDPALAQAFVDYVLSPGGQAILQKWGFLPVK